MQHIIEKSLNSQMNGLNRPQSQLEYAVASIQDILASSGIIKNSISVITPRETVHSGDNKHLYCLGELTMPFISAMVLKLQELGKLNIDDSIQKHFNGIDNFLPEAKNISIRQLLSHSSGIPDYKSSALFNEYKKISHSNYNVYDVLNILQNQNVIIKPFDTDKYGKCFSRTNYLILGKLIEIKTHLPLAQAVCLFMFRAAGVFNIKWGNSESKIASLKLGSADCAIMSNCIDTINFFKMLLTDRFVLKRSSAKKMLNENLGFFKGKCKTKNYFYHAGDVKGHGCSYFIYLPNEENNENIMVCAVCDYQKTGQKNVIKILKDVVFTNLEYLFV